MLESSLIDKLIELALAEDLAEGDITSKLTLDPEQVGKAEILAKENLIFCGGFLIERIIRSYRSNLKVKLNFAEGDAIKQGQIIGELAGRVVDLLSLERTILNFLQHMSGIATHAKRLSEKAAPLVLLDTRKTTPGWRLLEKYAVKVGGAKNHRMSLGDMILIKDNHIDACGGIKATLEKVYRDKPADMPVEIEVRDLKELNQALEFKPNIIMLDNMSYDDMEAAINIVNEKSPATELEVSGGVNIDNFKDLNRIGAKLASMSALSIQAMPVDISMKITKSSG
ncbi:MAG: carboxylating nicotinate-nucleotide diphosphorylase [Bdellovibrionota bacterium]